MAIGGKGLPTQVKFADDVEDAGLTNVSSTILNLLGFEAPPHMRQTLLALPAKDDASAERQELP